MYTYYIYIFMHMFREVYICLHSFMYASLTSRRCDYQESLKAQNALPFHRYPSHKALAADSD